MTKVQRYPRKRRVFTKPDGSRGWRYCSFDKTPEHPCFLHIAAYDAVDSDTLSYRQHEATKEMFVRFFPEIADAIAAHGLVLTARGGFSYATMRSRTHFRAEGRYRPLRDFEESIAPFLRFLPFFNTEAARRGMLFNHRVEETDLAEEFCPHKVSVSWPNLGEQRDVISAPYLYDWSTSTFWFRSQADAAVARMVMA